MDLPIEDLFSVLGRFNPWWRREPLPDLPVYRRAAFSEIYKWAKNPPAHRALLISGARQIGKTTLLLQVVDQLLSDGIPPANILYVTLDHPLFKLAGIETILTAWRQREPRVPGTEFVLLDEAHLIPDWATWIKHQVDFSRDRRIFFTGSATPLLTKDQESGVGRWHAIRLATLSFFEYCTLKRIDLPKLPVLSSLKDLHGFPPEELIRIQESAELYSGHFHDYLVRGGFPQTALVDSIRQAQSLLREDILDKVLNRDMTLIFGVRRPLELEKLFLYLCLHNGSLLDVESLSKNLEVRKPTVLNYISFFEAANLIYRLLPFGYGKQILRARQKIYLADPSLAPAVLLQGKSILSDPAALGVAAETAVFKHIFTHFYRQKTHFSYWRGKKGHEVDLIAELAAEIVAFETKYRLQHTGPEELKGLVEFCRQESVSRAWVVTRSSSDLGPLDLPGQTPCFKIPAPLLCYWLGEIEARGGN